MWKQLLGAAALALCTGPLAAASQPFLSSEMIWADYEPTSDILLIEGDVTLAAGQVAALEIFGGIGMPGGLLDLLDGEGAPIYSATLEAVEVEPDGLRLRFDALPEAAGPDSLSLWLALPGGAHPMAGFSIVGARIEALPSPVPLPAAGLLMAGALFILRLKRS